MPLKCFKCSLFFRDHSALMTHKQTCGTKEKTYYQCPFCPAMGTSRHDFWKKHVEKVHALDMNETDKYSMTEIRGDEPYTPSRPSLSVGGSQRSFMAKSPEPRSRSRTPVRSSLQNLRSESNSETPLITRTVTRSENADEMNSEVSAVCNEEDKENIPDFPPKEDHLKRSSAYEEKYEENEDVEEEEVDFNKQPRLEVDLEASPPSSPKKPEGGRRSDWPKPRHTHYRRNLTHPDGTKEVVEEVEYYGEPEEMFPCCRKYFHVAAGTD